MDCGGELVIELAADDVTIGAPATVDCWAPPSTIGCWPLVGEPAEPDELDDEELARACCCCCC